MPSPLLISPEVITSAVRYLKRKDPTLGKSIRQIGACTLAGSKMRSPYESLVRAVAHQQLHGKAAETILARFVNLTPGKRFPSPEEVLALAPEALRGVGFSLAKAHSIRDIAEKTQSKVVPSTRVISKLDDDAIVERLTEVRGIGRWTVEMLLIFHLGRADILPADDFGVRAGFRVVYGLPEMPRPKELLAHGELWRPYRTVAAWYLWRAADRAKANSP
ncbi:MAG: DNA-3-methyladenine glycosylase [Polyangiaceae bacterium]|nr:DNA-3-methyladenine glycosylase [Polyangiaceae bacterium]